MSATQPEELHALFLDAVNNHDLDALMDLYEPDPIGADLDGKLLQGTSMMRDFLADFLTVTASIEATTRKCIVFDDIALLSSTWHATIQTPDGQTATSNGASAEVARRQPDGSWRFIIDDPLFVSTLPG